MNILFVCLGNICRSPIAEGIMRQIFAERSIEGMVDSAATTDWNVGRSADSRAIKIAQENGIDIGAHRARQICTDDFRRFDLIFSVDRQNEIALRKVAPAAERHKIRLLCKDNDIGDPYSGNENTFRQTYRLIEQCCMEIASQLSDSGAT